MNRVSFDDRYVIDIQIDGIDTRDYPDFVDAYVSSAVWEDTGKELTEQELDEFTSENSELVYQLSLESLF